MVKVGKTRERKVIIMKKFGLILLLSLGLVACTQQESTENEEVEVLPLEVNLAVPANGEKNEEITLTAEVYYGDEKVTDATEVLFEIWKDGEKEESQKVEGKHSENGIYEVMYTFEEDGVYFVQSHVTAKDQHNMPKKQIVIGNPEEAGSTDESHNDLDESHEESHHHGDETVLIEMNIPDAVQKNEEQTLTTTVEKEGTIISGADVRYEIWMEGAEHHDWIEAVERNENYSASYSFEESGQYFVKVHVSNDEGLHEHIEKPVHVR